MENLDENSFDETFEGAPKKRRRQEDLKKKHNITSQKGRQKINEAIQTLKSMLSPDMSSTDSNKASILQCAISSLDRLRSEVATLVSHRDALQHHIHAQSATISDLIGQLNTFRSSSGMPLLSEPAPFDLGSSVAPMDNAITHSTNIGSVSSPGSDTQSSTCEESGSYHDPSVQQGIDTSSSSELLPQAQEFAPVYEYYNPATHHQSHRSQMHFEEAYSEYYATSKQATYDSYGVPTYAAHHDASQAPYYNGATHVAAPAHPSADGHYNRNATPAAPGAGMSLSTAFNLGLFAVFFLAIFPLFMISQGFEGASISFVGTTRSLASVPIETSLAMVSYFHRSSSFWSGMTIFVMLGVLVGATWWALRKIGPVSAPEQTRDPCQPTVYAGASVVEKSIPELSVSSDCVIPSISIERSRPVEAN